MHLISSHWLALHSNLSDNERERESELKDARERARTRALLHAVRIRIAPIENANESDLECELECVN